ALFDLAHDPAEAQNLAAERPGDVAALRGVLAELALQSAGSPAETPYTPEEQAEIEQRLRDLGYL
ncbi:MAG: hypothetical protein ACOC46_00590, partial [Pirellulales bacterium]